MPDYTVTNAGTAACNGDYTANGTYNTKPCYEIAGGGMWMRWQSQFDTEWRITDTLGSPGTIYWSYGPNPEDGSWYASLGANPPPTVTVYEAAAGVIVPIHLLMGNRVHGSL